MLKNYDDKSFFFSKSLSLK